MFSKIIFVLATVYVVNASVISVNVFDDDPETELASNPKGCNVRACEQLCRRLKFSGGACVNGRCKCDNFLNADDEVSEKTFSALEDSVSQTDDSEAEVAAIPSRCNLKVCDLVCRWLNKTSGSCVDGRCKCAKSIIAEDAVSESNVEDSVPSRACNNKKCNQLCRKQKFRGGACLGANCYCNKFLSLLEETEQPPSKTTVDPAESVPLSSCNSIACDDQCRRTGWHSGVCINGQCKCDYFLNTEDTMDDLEETISLDDNFLSTEDDVSDESLPASELSENQTERGCNMRACDQLCRRLKFPGGACVNGRCKCDNFFGTEDAVDEYSEIAPRRVCRLTKCHRKCTRRGYEGATCVNGRCKCYNSLQEKDYKISETSLPVFKSSEDQTERGCNMRACDQLCRRLKFPGGACVNNRCKCNNFFGAEETVDEYSELATRRVCKLRQCNRTCTRRGYEGARCVNGWCKCHNKIQRQDASPLNDVNSDENEESNVVLRTKEDELMVPSPSACNTVTCNQMCHHLNNVGGWCRFGQCQCYYN